MRISGYKTHHKSEISFTCRKMHHSRPDPIVSQRLLRLTNERANQRPDPPAREGGGLAIRREQKLRSLVCADQLQFTIQKPFHLQWNPVEKLLPGRFATKKESGLRSTFPFHRRPADQGNLNSDSPALRGSAISSSRMARGPHQPK